MDDNDESVKKDPRKIRTVQIIPHFHRLAEGSVLYKAEGTVVLVTASIDENVPEFMRGRGVDGSRRSTKCIRGPTLLTAKSAMGEAKPFPVERRKSSGSSVDPFGRRSNRIVLEKEP